MNDKREQLMGSDGAASVNQEGGGPGQADPADPKAGPLGAVPMGPMDEPIVAAIGRGERRDALRLCTHHHGAAIGRLCMALTGSQAEADDLTQDTLLTAYDAFPSYRAQGSLRSWLLAIARRKCARHVERRSRRESKLRLVHHSQHPPAHDELVLKTQRAQFARVALADIRPSEREALLLRYVSELSYREVADACGVEEATARKRVSRAICKLRTVLASKESGK